MRLPLTVLEAFTVDSQAAEKLSDLAGEQVQHWLAVASAAETFSRLRGRRREAYLAGLQSDLLPSAGERPTIVHDVAPPPVDVVEQAVERFRCVAEEMERGGFLNLAYTVVASVCSAVGARSGPVSHMATIHLGRIARQLSDTSVATDCYRTVVSGALRTRDGPSAARGFLGLGMLAYMSGNYPLVRRHFERALRHAHPGGNAQGLAHMGLSNVARRQGQLADALLHGWRAHDLATHPDERLGIVSNLAQVAEAAGFPEAAIKGVLHVVTHSSIPEVRLGVYNTLLPLAAKLGDGRLNEFEQAAIECATRYNQPFQISSIYLSAAEARAIAGRPELARAHADRSLQMARVHGYHELVHKAEMLLEQLDAPVSVPTATRSTWQADSDIAVGISRFEALGV